jgi:hypothetical protein
MKLKPLQSKSVQRLLWAEGVIASDPIAAYKLHEIKDHDPLGYEFLLDEIREFGKFSPETSLLLAILMEDEMWERIEMICQAIVIMSMTEVRGAERN